MTTTFSSRAMYDRLRSLSRSPEQDLVVSRLIEAGLEMKTLDTATPSKVLIFRDRCDQRWIVRRNGAMEISGRTNWAITSTGDLPPRKPTPLR